MTILSDQTPSRDVSAPDGAPGSSASDATFMRSVLDASGDCIKILDIDGKLMFMTDAGMTIMDVADFDAVRGCPWPEFWEGEGRVNAIAAVAEARAGRVARFVGAANTLVGTRKWWDVQVTPMRGPDGVPDRLLAVSRDISALKAAEERQHLLMQELAHRVKNVFSIVQAIALQTLCDEDGEPSAASDTFMGRLRALAEANDVLLQTSWQAADIRRLVELTARAHDDKAAPRFRIDGPAVTLGPKTALRFALVIHELATNAMKHGALSVREGRVAVTWALKGVDRMSFRWEEIGGPAVAPPSHQGFGTTLIEASFPPSPMVTAALAYPPTAVVFSLDAALAPMRGD